MIEMLATRNPKSTTSCGVHEPVAHFLSFGLIWWCFRLSPPPLLIFLYAINAVEFFFHNQTLPPSSQHPLIPTPLLPFLFPISCPSSNPLGPPPCFCLFFGVSLGLCVFSPPSTCVWVIFSRCVWGAAVLSCWSTGLCFRVGGWGGAAVATVIARLLCSQRGVWRLTVPCTDRQRSAYRGSVRWRTRCSTFLLAVDQ